MATKRAESQEPVFREDDDLPEGWTATTIGDITVPKVDQSGPGNYQEFLYVDIASVDNERKSIIAPRVVAMGEAPSRARQLVRPGDVLVSMTRPNLNGVALVGPELDGSIASTGFDVLRSIECLPGWLFLIVRGEAFIEAMTASVQGALYPAIRPRDVRGFEFPLPPLPEQRRIVEKVETLLARVNAARARLARAPAILKAFRQAVLSAACSGILTEGWRGGHFDRPPSNGPMADSETNGPEDLPMGWRWSCPEEIKAGDPHSLAIGPFGSSLMVKDYRSFGVPLVFVREIRSGRFGGPGTRFISGEKAAELKAHSIAGGDLLITKMGDPPGDTAIYPIDAPDAVITADCIKLRVNRLVANSAFVGIVIESPLFKEKLQEITAGVAQQKISLARFRKFPIQLPTLPEQNEIVRRVEALFALSDPIEVKVRAAQKRADALTQAILAKAFRGELVPTEAALARAEGRPFESAKELLQRVRLLEMGRPTTNRSGQRVSRRKSKIPFLGGER